MSNFVDLQFNKNVLKQLNNNTSLIGGSNILDQLRSLGITPEQVQNFVNAVRALPTSELPNDPTFIETVQNELNLSVNFYRSSCSKSFCCCTLRQSQ